MGLRSIRHGAAPIALTVLFSFGCATVRVPASAMGSEVAVGEDGPEPQVELWLESGTPVSEAEKAKATAEVKAALEHATETLVSDDGEALLVVRAQGIARTTSRKSNQQAAKVGIAVGAVAVVAVIVVAILSGKGSPSGGGGGPKFGGARVAPRVPRVAPAGVPRFRLPSGGISGRHPAHLPGAVGIHLDATVPVQGAPQELVAVSAVTPPEAIGGTGDTGARPVAEPITIHLPPPRPLDMGQRKFFDKDLTRLELIVVDRESGEATWVKTVEGKIDPRDVRAVRALLAGAIEGRDGWTSVGPPGAE